MNGKDVKSILITALSLFLICAVAAGALALVNTVTAPTIAANNAAAADKARGEVLPAADSFEENTAPDGAVYYTGKSGGVTVGYVFTTSAKGYGGDVEIMTGVDAEGRVTGISILSIEETPGLGMNAKKDSFKEQYKGKSGQLAVNKDGGEIVAITSATITSRAVTNAVNQALALYAGVA